MKLLQSSTIHRHFLKANIFQVIRDIRLKKEALSGLTYSSPPEKPVEFLILETNEWATKRVTNEIKAKYRNSIKLYEENWSEPKKP